MRVREGFIAGAVYFLTFALLVFSAQVTGWLSSEIWGSLLPSVVGYLVWAYLPVVIAFVTYYVRTRFRKKGVAYSLRLPEWGALIGSTGLVLEAAGMMLINGSIGFYVLWFWLVELVFGEAVGLESIGYLLLIVPLLVIPSYIALGVGVGFSIEKLRTTVR